MREVEGVVFDEVHAKAEEDFTEAALSAGSTYASAVRNSPGHTWGSPHLHIFAACIESVTMTEPPAGGDAGLRCRWWSLKMLRVLFQEQTMEGVGTWVRSFRASKMYKQKDKPQMARIAFHIAGETRVPEAAELATLEAECVEKASLAEARLEIANRFTTLVDDVPVAARGRRSVPIQRLLVSILCCMGGSRKTGKAPRGALAYKLRRGLRGIEEE